MRRAAKRDKNEKELIKVLESLGFTVQQLNDPGIPDLLVGNFLNFLVEVKSESGTLTPPQREFIAQWGGQVKVVKTVQELKRFFLLFYLIHQYQCCETFNVIQNITDHNREFMCPKCGKPVTFIKTIGHLYDFQG